jgi:hypothetical protein
VIWAQYGNYSSHIAALNGTVAVLITRWMHDEMSSFAGIAFRLQNT